MTHLQLVALILAGIGPMLALGRLLPVPDSLILFAAGLATALVPGLPPLRLDPQLALQLFLPALLYAGTVRASFHLLRHTLASGVVLGALASLATVGVVALAARGLLPGLPWPAAFMLGAVAAVFDTRVFHEAQGRPHVPRAVADALKTREMVARVVALSCFGLATDAAAGAPASALTGLAWELVGGAVAGVALGRGVVWLRERIDPAPVEIAVSIATPYLGSLAAAALGLSTVVVVMGAALTVSAGRVDPATGAPRASSEARISATAFWEEASLILSAVLFFLAGRVLPETAAALDDRPLAWLAGVAVALTAAVLAVEFAAALLAATLRPPAEELGAAEEGRGRLPLAGVLAWASTRSVIGLILALSIPPAPPDGGDGPSDPRALVLALATLLIVGSVLLQGLTLNAVVRRAGLRDEGEREREGRAAREAEAEAGETDFDARRRALLALRGRNRIGDELLRERLREIDLRQRAGEDDALPGAGPPNP